MKKARWILMVSTLALFSAHQTHHSDADKPDYRRNPAAIVRPVYDLKAGKNKAGAHKVQRAKAKFRNTNDSI